jgi:hypothetical protein
MTLQVARSENYMWPVQKVLELFFITFSDMPAIE